MTWTAYRAGFRIQSPVHLGYNAVSHVERTRYYVPARNMLSALAYRAAEETEVAPPTGPDISSYFRFTNFFVSGDGEEALFPGLDEDGDLFYGLEKLSAFDFNNRYISNKEAAKQGLLNTPEIEFITARDQVSEKPSFLVGYLFAAPGAADGFPGWLPALRELKVGEETNFGFGKIELQKMERLPGDRGSLFRVDGITADWSGETVRVVYDRPNPLLAHTLFQSTRSVGRIYGISEQLEGRRDLVRGRVESATAGTYWVPGTLIHPAASTVVFEIGREGIWRTGGE